MARRTYLKTKVMIDCHRCAVWICAEKWKHSYDVNDWLTIVLGKLRTGAFLMQWK